MSSCSPSGSPTFHVEQTPSRVVPEAPDGARLLFGDQLGAIKAYAATLADTGVDHGLIGPREVPRLWDRHLLNCGAVTELIAADSTVADLGSGAGLPGLVLAIARPDLHIVLLEPLQRRVTWLETTIKDLHLENVVVRRDRADQATDLQVDVVTSRAVAALPKLARWSLPLLREHGTMLALKGSSAEAELASAVQMLKQAGATSCDVVQCGGKIIDPPATVIRIRLGDRARRDTRVKRAFRGTSGGSR